MDPPNGNINKASNKGPLGLINIIRQKFNIPKFRNTPVLTDAPENWRTSVGGSDPATPYAEAMINYHNHAVTYMIFVVLTVVHAIKKKLALKLNFSDRIIIRATVIALSILYYVLFQS